MTPRPLHERSVAGRLSRRQLLRAAAGLGMTGAGLGLLAACRGGNASLAVVAPDAPLETTHLTLAKTPNLCFAPQYVAEALLRAEGFTEITYRPTTQGAELDQLLASGEIDIAQDLVVTKVTRVDAGDPIVLLGGVHSGCAEIFATDRVRSVRDLRGKTVGVSSGGGGRLFVSSVVAYVGLDPHQDITWVEQPSAEVVELLAAGKVDACSALPPAPQQLRARGINRVILNTGLDRPWSQYFCCMLVGNREFVRRHPVATKRAMRAILKAVDLCAGAPDSSARFLVDNGYTAQYDFASQAMREVPYNRWREYDPEDTVRFYALRLKEIGAIKSSPNDIIERGTDWRLFNELKQELKA